MAYITLDTLYTVLRASAMLKHVIAIGWTSVRPSVCPSVTRWYCIKTAQPIVKLSSRQFYLNYLEQEGLRASVSAISVRHNLATSRESRRYVVACTRFASECNAFGYLKRVYNTFWPSCRYAPGTIAVNFTWIERQFNACQTVNASQHVPIYLQPFTSYSEILVGNCNFFLPP